MNAADKTIEMFLTPRFERPLPEAYTSRDHPTGPPGLIGQNLTRAESPPGESRVLLILLHHLHPPSRDFLHPYIHLLLGVTAGSCRCFVR